MANECFTQKTQESKVNSSDCGGTSAQGHGTKGMNVPGAFPGVSNNSFKNIVEKPSTEDSNSTENAGRNAQDESE